MTLIIPNKNFSRSISFHSSLWFNLSLILEYILFQAGSRNLEEIFYHNFRSWLKLSIIIILSIALNSINKYQCHLEFG